MEGKNINYRLLLTTMMMLMLIDNVFSSDFSMNSAGTEYRIPNLLLHNFINRINEQQQDSLMNPMDMVFTGKDSIENNYMYPDSSVSIQIKQTRKINSLIF